MQKGDILRYLGLPGEDLLDIRSLRGVCEPGGIWVKYLGFDSTANLSKGEFEFHLAEHEVAQSGFINQHSRILKARIEHVANEASLAYKYTSNTGISMSSTSTSATLLPARLLWGRGRTLKRSVKLCHLQVSWAYPAVGNVCRYSGLERSHLTRPQVQAI